MARRSLALAPPSSYTEIPSYTKISFERGRFVRSENEGKGGLEDENLQPRNSSAERLRITAKKEVKDCSSTTATLLHDHPPVKQGTAEDPSTLGTKF